MVRRFDDDPALVVAAQAGDADAFTTLFRRWFDPCADVARRIVHDEETAAEVAQETFLVAWRQLSTLRDPSAFGGWVLRTSRNKALNRLERERHSVAVDQEDDPVLAQLEAVDDVPGEVTAADQQALLWAASAALGERDASVLDLHLRHGMDVGEIATVLDITPNNAHQVLFRMKGRLAGAIRAWVLYKGGDPSCPELRRVLRAADVTSFSAEAVKVIDRHVASCDDCTSRRAALLAPEAMFAAVPVLPVGALLRDRVASGLRDSGVPLGPDATVPAPGSGGSEGGGSPQAPDGSATTQTTPVPATTAASHGSASPGEVAAGGDAPPPVAAVRSGDRRILVAVLAVAAIALLVGGLMALRAGDDQAASEVETVVETTVPRSATSVTTVTTTTEAPIALPEPTPTTTRAPTTTATVPPVVPPSVTPPPAPPAPQVLSFTATANGTCAAGGFRFTLVWSTADATGVSIVPSDPLPGGVPVTGGPQGTAVACALTPGSTWTLTAAGPGGTATATD